MYYNADLVPEFTDNSTTREVIDLPSDKTNLFVPIFLPYKNYLNTRNGNMAFT